MSKGKGKDKAAENMTEEKAGRILDFIYEKAMDGIPKVSRSVDELAGDYLTRHTTPEEAALALSKVQVAKCGTSGFLAGLGGLITLPATLPANISSVLYVQIRMVAAIARIGGYDTKSDQVQTLVYLCLTGNAISDVLKGAGVQIGEKALFAAIRKIPGEVLTKINQKIGFRLITKFGEKGVINLGKMVPVVGGLVGGGFDVASTTFIAKNAIKVFINNETPDGEIITEEEVIEVTAIDTSADDDELL